MTDQNKIELNEAALKIALNAYHMTWQGTDYSVRHTIEAYLAALPSDNGAADDEDLITEVSWAIDAAQREFNREANIPHWGKHLAKAAISIIRNHPVKAGGDFKKLTDEEQLGFLAEDILKMLCDHVHNCQTPLRTKLCALIRPYIIKPLPLPAHSEEDE